MKINESYFLISTKRP